MNHSMRILLAATALCTAPVVAAAQPNQNFNIPAGPLKDALDQFSKVTGRAVLYRSAEVEGARSQGARGAMTHDQALSAILKGTGFELRLDRSGAVAVVKSAPIAQAVQESPAAILEELVVTARKRAESINDVPASISVLSGASLRDRGASAYRDYLNGMPGVALADFGDNASTVIIRGQATAPDGAAATVTYLDEVALGSPLGSTEFKPVDLERVEVLKGAQGTVFGSGSIGGIVRLIPKAPVMGETSGYIDASVLGRAGGDSLGTDVSGAANLAVGEKVAVRLVGYRDQTPDFIENLRDRRDVGGSRKTGGRLSLAVVPNDKSSVLLSYSSEHGRSNGGYGSFIDSDRLQTNSGPSGRRWQSQVATGKLTYDLGPATLTSVTGYVAADTQSLSDVTLFTFLPFFGVDPEYNIGRTLDTTTKLFSQEVRLSSAGHGPLTWIAGAFYSQGEATADYKQFNADTGEALDPITGSLVALTQVAGFGEATYKITPQIEAAAGVRYSEYRGKTYYVDEGVKSSPLRIKAHNISPRFSLSYKPVSRQTYYVSASRGFRPGGPNATAPSECSGESLPDQYGPDSAWNYEAGAKVQSTGGRFSLSAAAYQIDWTDFPVFANATTCAFAYYKNAGTARTRGLEAETAFSLSPAWSLRASGSYSHAELTSDEGGFASGQRLPGSPDVTATLALDYQAPLAATDLTAFATVEGQYLGSIKSYLNEDFASVAYLFNIPSERPLYGGKYGTLSLRGGVRSDTWRASLFVNNLFDERGANTINIINASGRAQRVVSTPRTVGLALGYSF